jgi:hypothetical protein
VTPFYENKKNRLDISLHNENEYINLIDLDAAIDEFANIKNRRMKFFLNYFYTGIVIFRIFFYN